MMRMSKIIKHKDAYLKTLENAITGGEVNISFPNVNVKSPYHVELNEEQEVSLFAHNIGSVFRKKLNVIDFIADKLEVKGNSIFNSDLLTKGVLTVNGNSNLNGDLSVKGVLKTNNTLTTNGKITSNVGSVSAYNDTLMLGYYGWFDAIGDNCYAVKVSNSYLVGTKSGFHVYSGTNTHGELFAKNISSSYTLTPTQQIIDLKNHSVFDDIYSINVVDTEDGLRLINNPTKLVDTKNTSNIVYTNYNENTNQEEIVMNYNSAISTLWKAVQELKQENEELKKLIKGES